MTERLRFLTDKKNLWKTRHTFAAALTVILIVLAFLGVCPVMLFMRQNWELYLLIAVLISHISIFRVGYCIYKMDKYDALISVELLNMNKGQYFNVNIVDDELVL